MATEEQPVEAGKLFKGQVTSVLFENMSQEKPVRNLSLRRLTKVGTKASCAGLGFPDPAYIVRSEQDYGDH